MSVGAASEDFRSVVLRGRNVASFKFALATSVLTLAESGATSASLEDLAVPFSRELCTHIGEVDTTLSAKPSRRDGEDTGGAHRVPALRRGPRRRTCRADWRPSR